ncbi:MAG TPA: hypothetical protein VGM78_10455 [Ilumatobacteraceae bacterium]
MSSTMLPTEHDLPGRWWWIALGGIILWMAHVMAEISLVRISQRHGWIESLMDVITVVLALAAAGFTVACRRLLRRSSARPGGAESSVAVAGRTTFIAWLGLYVGTTSVVLIVVEGVYLVAIGNHG